MNTNVLKKFNMTTGSTRKYIYFFFSSFVTVYREIILGEFGISKNLERLRLKHAVHLRKT